MKMNRTLAPVSLFLSVASALIAKDSAPDAMEARAEEIAISSEFVSVPLDAYANDFKEQSFPGTRVTVGGIPFDLIERKGSNNLFLSSAHWSDWKKDPSSFYADYDKLPAEASPERPLFKIPVADYAAVYILASTDPSMEFSPDISFRLGAIDYSTRLTMHDFSASVPRENETGGPGVVKKIDTGNGHLFLMRVPLGKSLAQDFKDRWHLDLEVTKALRLAIRSPDPCRFQIRPLGLPSGVRIYGMTLKRSSAQMEVTSDEAGHVFNEPQVPTFHVTLRNPSSRHLRGTLKGLATDFYGTTTTLEHDGQIELAPGRSKTVSLPIKTPMRGHHDLVISFNPGNGDVIERHTTFAALAQDTRQHRDESPFGTWDFMGTHYTPDDPSIVGPLYVKAGLRYGLFKHTEEIRRKYGILNGQDQKILTNEPDLDKDVATKAALLKENYPNEGDPKRWMIFHETTISEAHITRLPDVFTDQEPYKLNKKENERFQEFWGIAERGAKAIKAHYPDTEIYFGNGPSTFLEEFVRHKFPKELLGSRGNEAGSFQRLPETQFDPIANNSSLWMDRQILDHYGYNDTPLRQCYEVIYPSTNPGNLSPRTHASYLIRHLIHSLAWEIPIIRPAMIADAGNSYYFSHWGATGLCYAWPNLSPKPAYVAIATLTQALDGASFRRVIETTSPTTYAVEFQRRDKKIVTCLWTVRGTRDLELAFSDAKGGAGARITDLMGNPIDVSAENGKATVRISSAPLFLETSGPLKTITPGATQLEQHPGGKSVVISPLGKLADWSEEEGNDPELESYNFLCHRRKGDFSYREVASFAGQDQVLEVKPKLPVKGTVYAPMYSALKANTAIEIPGEPTEIGLMVHGNGGWGRIIFEVEDASGQRWISIGAERDGAPPNQLEELTNAKSANVQLGVEGKINDWNSDDAWGRSYINFEGWRYLRFPLPGNYPGEKYHWPFNSQWRWDKDGIVHYPITFKRLIVTLPEKVLRFKAFAPIKEQEIYLKDLTVTYDAPETAFVAE